MSTTTSIDVPAIAARVRGHFHDFKPRLDAVQASLDVDDFEKAEIELADVVHDLRNVLVHINLINAVKRDA